MDEQNSIEKDEVWNDQDQPDDITDNRDLGWDWIVGPNRANINDNRSYEDQWDTFMFGPRHSASEQSVNQQEHSTNQSNIDFGELIYNIEVLMESVQNLKPLLKKFYPYLQQIWKKK